MILELDQFILEEENKESFYLCWNHSTKKCSCGLPVGSASKEEVEEGMTYIIKMICSLLKNPLNDIRSIYFEVNLKNNFINTIDWGEDD